MKHTTEVAELKEQLRVKQVSQSPKEFIDILNTSKINTLLA